MKTTRLLLCALPLLLTAPQVMAVEDAESAAEKHIIVAVKGDDLELAKTDISHLGVGDAETVYTDDGKTVDLLRTGDGVEVYVDGELVATGPNPNLDAGPGKAHKRIQIICKDEEEESNCEDLAMLELGDIDPEALGADGQQVIVIRGDDEELNSDDEEHKVIVIKKTVEEI
jgi:hypothetical protein